MSFPGHFTTGRDPLPMVVELYLEIVCENWMVVFTHLY